MIWTLEMIKMIKDVGRDQTLKLENFRQGFCEVPKKMYLCKDGLVYVSFSVSIVLYRGLYIRGL